MVKEGKSSKPEQDAKQGIDRETEEARQATIARMNEKMKRDGSKPLPRRGEVKKRIVKDVMDALKGRGRSLRSSWTTPVHDGSVWLTEEAHK